MKNDNLIKTQCDFLENDFKKISGVIQYYSARASRGVNEESLRMYWTIGGFISDKLKTNAWGSKVVTQLSEYLRAKDPALKGYSRRNLYNMVSLYDTYSTDSFKALCGHYGFDEIMQMSSARLISGENTQLEIVQTNSAQIPAILYLTTFSNHIEIINNCRSYEERLFYILYSYREKLKYKELQRCIKSQAFTSIMSQRTFMSDAVKETYPNASVIFRDTLFLDFLNLPKRHSEKRLHKGILEHMKQFILELGKDFLFVDSEYVLEIGGGEYKIDLLFFHRGLQCLVAVELKSRKFKPSDLGQLEFYLEALDRDVKRSNENPSIGILLCQDANESVVEYALSRSMSPTLITEYKRLLIPREVLQKSLDEYVDFIRQE